MTQVKRKREMKRGFFTRSRRRPCRRENGASTIASPFSFSWRMSAPILFSRAMHSYNYPFDMDTKINLKNETKQEAKKRRFNALSPAAADAALGRCPPRPPPRQGRRGRRRLGLFLLRGARET